MKKKLLLFACIACAMVVLTSCEKKYKSGVVTFYGNVIDENTGDPLPVVQIKIEGNKGVATVSTVTGSDGTYEVDVTLPSGEEKKFDLKITFSKKDYGSYDRFFNVTRDMVGKRVQQSFTI